MERIQGEEGGKLASEVVSGGEILTYSLIQRDNSVVGLERDDRQIAA